MQLLADIATNNTDLADVCFLVAVILAVLSALVAYVPRPEAAPGYARFTGPLLSGALAAVALGLLVL